MIAELQHANLEYITFIWPDGVVLVLTSLFNLPEAHLYTQSIPSFSLMILPSLESMTASVSPSAFFFKNFFSPAFSINIKSQQCHHAYHMYGCSVYKHGGQRETLSLILRNKYWTCKCYRRQRGAPLPSLLSTTYVAAANASVVFSNL